ncbi:prolyl oligopeptidase family serine peptidase [Bacillus cereus group sp. MYBK245-2]|uniref:Translocation protein TolB n=1 Tax=Bacillus pacificus TaxID=2026187 RepID=A0A1Y5YT82_9BACI|nr:MULTISPECIES: prolyl oligopeptidase family serine peptidase [Bacillus cereus group]PEB04691.1 S9 family peptidase [Bacillus cereus]MCZ7524821.1 S9 family peptidase [Bacillus pacificus]MDA1576759.1 prolyl oligopeptidase family serine peptidase [Bacillus cereus group sp. TH242-3LC]MED1588399.1 prolyl oligopeptidase family serine peptidase [Bacillus pacificus]RRA95199.1 S9 family peptidase [Bacillus pacificus]
MNVKEKTYLSIEEIISLPTLSSTNISDDGKNVAFVKRTANWKDNTYRNHVWIYEKGKGQSYPLTNGDIDSTCPLWSPNSRDIAYLSPVGNGKSQIFVKSLDGYGGAQITNEEEGISTFKWDPTGKGFYYITQSKECEEIKKRKELYGDFQHVGKEHQNNCLCYIEIEKVIQNDKEERESNGVYQLTDGKDFYIHDFDISNDGKKVVCMATPIINDHMNGDLYILDVEAGELQKMNMDKLLGGSVCFSPEGSKMCYAASIREKEYYRNHIQESTLEIYDMHTGEVIQPLTNFDSTVMPLQWTAKGILIRWQDKTNYRIGLLAEDGTVKALSDKIDGFIMDASITRDGNHITYNKAITNETFEIYLDDKKITNENSFFDGKLKSNREIISWKSSDGLEIEGILTTPVNFDANKKYPLLVVIHGGPAWASFPIFSDCFNEKYPIEQFVEKGIVDKDRVGVMGWSNGGYISAFCSTFSDRFKAISVGGGITNWSTHYVNTDIPYFIKMHLGNTPWNEPEIYTKTSPMTYIKSACTPTLIQHGEKDARIPITNAYELYEGLRDMEVDAELIIFKGMAYSSNQPGMNVAIMNQNFMWFSHYILGGSMEGFRTI